MKIAVLASGYPPDIRGGGEFSSQVIAESLKRRGADVHVLTCGATEDERIENDVSIRRIKSPNIYWNFKPKGGPVKKAIWHARENFNPTSRQVIKDFLSEKKPDIFFTSTMENFGAEAWRASHDLGIKTVHVLRSYYPICPLGAMFKNGETCDTVCSGCKLGSIGRRNASQYVDGVIGLSRVTLSYHLREGLFRNAIYTVLPDPVSAFPVSSEPKTLTRDPVFGYLGFLTPNKGVELIAQALKSDPALANCRVVIAGTGEATYVSSLKQQFEGLNVEFIGWQKSEVFLRDIDFLIVPSVFREPFGRIVAEAFTEGTPVVGSATGGIGEMVVPGHNGFHFQPGDYKSLAVSLAAANTAGADQYARFSQNALATAIQFTGDVVAKNNLRFFEEVLNGSLPPAQEWVA